MTQAKARMEREGVEGGDDAEAVVNAELEEGASETAAAISGKTKKKKKKKAKKAAELLDLDMDNDDASQ